MKNMLEKRLAELTGDKAAVRPPATVEVASKRSSKDMLLWLIAIALLIASTLVNTYLPGYWQPANNVWTRIAVIVALIVLVIGALAMTHQGSQFKTLLSDARVELRRVTWPSKSETTHYTWQVVLMTGILALMVWLMDTVFGQIIHAIIG